MIDAPNGRVRYSDDDQRSDHEHGAWRQRAVRDTSDNEYMSVVQNLAIIMLAGVCLIEETTDDKLWCSVIMVLICARGNGLPEACS